MDNIADGINFLLKCLGWSCVILSIGYAFVVGVVKEINNADKR